MSSDVFGSHYAAAYDTLYGEKDYQAESALVMDAISKFSGRIVKSISDWGCGTGAHTLRFAEAGLTVGAVDLSPGMLAAARAKVSEAGLDDRVSLVHGDVADADLGDTFDAAVMMFAVLGYQSTNGRVLETLRNVRRHLNPGALFIADVWYGPAVLSSRPTDRFRVLKTDDTTVLRSATTTLDTTAHTANVTFDLWTIHDGRVVDQSRETHLMRYFFPQEIALFLSTAGFDLISITEFPTLDQSATDQSWNVLIVAQAA